MRTLYWSLFFGVFASGSWAVAKANYDAAWTFLYDAGYNEDNESWKSDILRGVAVTDDGVAWCAGESNGVSMVMKIGPDGKMLVSKQITTENTMQTYYNNQTLHSLCLAKNGDVIVGGERFGSPWILRLDTLFNVKWSKWHYDSIKDERRLLGKGYINSICETSWGRIFCTGGDEYPDNNGRQLNNYLFLIDFDSLGNYMIPGEIRNSSGYTEGGFSIAEADGGNLLIAGNQAVVCIDSSLTIKWEKAYTATIEGVGTMSSMVNRVKQLRDGTLMVAGAAYEWNCWERYSKLYMDGWWTPVGMGGGGPTSWDTAGVSGGNDVVLDFVQLESGNIAFVGTKSTSPDTGVWVFVTDSTGKNKLWDKQFDMPGLDTNGFRRKGILPYAVAATPDSGFTVVGYLAHNAGNEDAIAMHFISVEPTPSITVAPVKQTTLSPVVCRYTGKKIMFECTGVATGNNATVQIVNAGGKVVAALPRNDKSTFVSWDCSRVSNGVYFWQATLNADSRVSGRVVVW